MRLMALAALATLIQAAELRAQATSDHVPISGNGSDGVLDHRLVLLASGQSFPTPWQNYKGLVLLRVKVNGRDAWAIIDNACFHTLIDLNLARSAGLEPGPVVSTIDLGPATVPERVIANTRIDVPGQMVLSGQVMGVDLTAFSKIVGHPIEVIIGGDYTSNVSLLVSSSSKELIFAKPGAITPKVRSGTLPLAGGNRLEAMVNGTPVTLLLDLGYNGAVRLTQDAWRRIIPSGAATTRSKTGSFDGTVRASQSVAHQTLAVGPITADDVTVEVGARIATTADGIVGTGFLSKFDFILDASANRFTAIPPG